MSSLNAYLAPEKLEKDLAEEISRHKDLRVVKQMERLFVVEGPLKPLIFAQNTWSDVQTEKINSIGDATKILKKQGKLWAPYSQSVHRRTNLIQEQLPKIKKKPFEFGSSVKFPELGAWTLEDANTLWFSSKTSSAFQNGEIEFSEDKKAPSRAYLKLWEFFTVENVQPQKSDICMDLGACPGGWTWVLKDLSKKVIAVDKAPLVPELQKDPQVQILKKDAFTLKPEDIGPIDWLFSDIICYPPKLLELVEVWRASGLVQNFVCTIKFQGKTDFETLERFQAIPGSKTQHLSVNKHEVTWSLLERDS